MAQTPATWDDYVGDGVEDTYQVTFPYQKEQEVFAYVDEVLASFTFISAGWIQFDAVPANGAAIRIQRSTEAFEPRHEFENGVPLLPRFIDENNKQFLYVVQEAVNETSGTAAEALAVAEEARDIAQEASDKVDAAVIESAHQLRLDLEDGVVPLGWTRSPLADAVTTVAQALDTTRVNVWEFANLVVTKPNPSDPSTWDWSPAVQAAFDSVGPVGSVQFTQGTFKFSGVTTSSTVAIYGYGAGATVLQNFTAGATMLTYNQVGMADKNRRNWLTFEGFTLIDEASFTGIGIKTNNVLSIIFRDCYVREFKTNYGLQILEALWVYLDQVNSDLCELNFVSTAIPHNNNVIAIRGGELRNPTPGRSSLYVEGGDIVSLRDSTIEGNAGGAGYISGGKFKNIKMLSLENTYFEVLQGATQGALVLETCQAVKVSRSQLNSQSTSVPSALLVDSDAVEFDRCAMVAFPLRTSGVCSVRLTGCMREGPIEYSATTAVEEIAPMPYNTRAAVITDPALQRRRSGKPRAYRNTYADSSFETAAPGVTIVAGAPVSSQDTTSGYYGTTSWRVTGVNGDIIRSASLGVTSSNGQSGCMSFMAKADTAARFGLTMFLGGAAGGFDLHLGTEYRRYFVITNLRPASVAGDAFLLQLAFQGTNAFNITDIQFIPFTDYGEVPGIIDGFNYLPTHGAIIPGAISRTVEPDKVWFDRLFNLRGLPVFADNAAATAGGLGVGDPYRTAVGAVHVRF